MTAQHHADDMARRALNLREREEAAGRWFEGRNSRSLSRPMTENHDPGDEDRS